MVIKGPKMGRMTGAQESKVGHQEDQGVELGLVSLFSVLTVSSLDFFTWFLTMPD